MNTATRVAATVLFLALAAIGQDEPKTYKPTAPSSPLDPVRFLIGNWTGTTQGEPGQGKGERHYELVLGGKVSPRDQQNCLSTTGEKRQG